MKTTNLGVAMPQITLPQTKEEVAAIDFGSLYKWTVPTFSWPYEQMKKAISDILATYTAIDVTNVEDIDEVKKNLKNDRAYLNALKKKFAEMDSTIRSDVLSAYDGYKSQSKELQDAITDAIDPIDAKVKEIETYWKEQKKNEILAFYTETVLGKDEIQDADELFAKIFDATWLNQTTSKKKYQEAITSAVSNYCTGVMAIKAMKHEFEADGLSMFEETHDLSKAIGEMTRKADLKQELLKKESEQMEARMKEALEQAEADKKKALEQAEAEKQEALHQAEVNKNEAVKAATINAQNEMAMQTTTSSIETIIEENTDCSDDYAEYISIKIPVNKFELARKVLGDFNIEVVLG